MLESKIADVIGKQELLQLSADTNVAEAAKRKPLVPPLARAEQRRVDPFARSGVEVAMHLLERGRRRIVTELLRELEREADV